MSDGSPTDIPKEFLDLVEIDKVLLPQSLHEFVKATWHVIEPGVPFKDNWHLKLICDHLQAVTEGKLKRLIINVPPRTGKSSIVSVLWPCWEWTRNASIPFMFASYALRLALRDNLRRRQIVESKFYQDRFGGKVGFAGEQREKAYFRNTAQGSMFASSLGSSNILGFGGLRLVLDDPQDPTGAESEVVRESVTEWLCRTWPSRKDSPEAAEVLIQQRLHEGDATGLYLKQGGWTHLKVPMEWEGDSECAPEVADPRRNLGEILDEVRFPKDFLEDLKKRLGPYGVAGQLQQRPAPMEGGIVKREWLKHYDVLKDGRISVMDGLYEYDAMSHFRFCTADLAAREKELGGPGRGQKTDPDYTVFAAWSVFITAQGLPILTLLDLVRERMEGPDILKKLKAFHRRWDFSVIGMETISFQLSMFQFARREGLPVREISTRRGGDVLYRIDTDKMGRMMRATNLLADGRFWIPAYASWLDAFESELCTFPNAAHDDMCDVVAYGVAIAERIRGRGGTKDTSPAPSSSPEEEERRAERNRSGPPTAWDFIEVKRPPGW